MEDLFIDISKKTTDFEGFNSFPKNYEKGKTKFVVVFGTVMSGLGKGIFSSSLALLLKKKGLKISPIKFDGYLNQDAGTLNPYRHGEVFVLDDGTESDMDLGTYERFLDIDITKDNYLTGGKIFNIVLSKERKGKYLGRDVQFIPHITGEIKYFLRNLAVETNSDLIFVEVGGTVGDIENMYFIEAMRELAYEEGRNNVSFVALTYILEPQFLGEQKSKAAQLGLRELMSLGIQPDIIACRAKNIVSEKVREKISIYSNVPINRVVSIHDCESIYLIPKLLEDANLDKEIINILNLKDRIKEDNNLIEKWNHYVKRLSERNKEITIGITGKYTGLRDSYASILHALEHSATHLGAKIKIEWIDTTLFDSNEIGLDNILKKLNGIIVPGGFGKRGAEGKIRCIEYARKNNVPFLGLCFGFQMATIEFARNVCNLKNANSTELDEKTPHPVIDFLPGQNKIKEFGASMRLGAKEVSIKQGTLAKELYKKDVVKERFRHRFECNPKYIEKLESAGLVFSGRAKDEKEGKIMQILELKNHKFFLATQYHPEFKSRPLSPHPLFIGFVSACLKETNKG